MPLSPLSPILLICGCISLCLLSYRRLCQSAADTCTIIVESFCAAAVVCNAATSDAAVCQKGVQSLAAKILKNPIELQIGKHDALEANTDIKQVPSPIQCLTLRYSHSALLPLCATPTLRYAELRSTCLSLLCANPGSTDWQSSD